MNHMLHNAAACQIRLDTPGRAYYWRKLAAGNQSRSVRYLKRRISTPLYRQLVADAKAASAEAKTSRRGPGGHWVRLKNPARPARTPPTDASDQPLPGPAPTTLPARTPARKSNISRPLQPAF
jgi:transposase